MKVGDLVKHRDDRYFTMGYGVVLETNTSSRWVLIHWFIKFHPPQWCLRASLETIKEWEIKKGDKDV